MEKEIKLDEVLDYLNNSGKPEYAKLVKELTSEKTILDYLKEGRPGTEFVILDDVYDTEYYMYTRDDNEDSDMKVWNDAMYLIASKLKAVEVRNSNGNFILVANMYNLIEKNIEKISDLFNDEPDVDDVMDRINPIMSGNVSESWLMKFAEAL